MKHIKLFEHYSDDIVIPFEVGMKIRKVDSDKSGKLVFYCCDGEIIEVATGGGSSVAWDGDIKSISNSTITDVESDPYSIILSFDNTDDLSMEDDTGGEGLEAWIKPSTYDSRGGTYPR